MLKKLVAKRKVENITRAEIKLLIILIYYVVNGVFGLANLTYSQLIFPPERRQAYEFICQLTGTRNEDCHLDTSLDTIRPLLIIFSIIIFTGLPLFVFIFSVNCGKCQRKLKKAPLVRKESGSSALSA